MITGKEKDYIKKLLSDENSRVNGNKAIQALINKVDVYLVVDDSFNGYITHSDVEQAYDYIKKVDELVKDYASNLTIIDGEFYDRIRKDSIAYLSHLSSLNDKFKWAASNMKEALDHPVLNNMVQEVMSANGASKTAAREQARASGEFRKHRLVYEKVELVSRNLTSAYKQLDRLFSAAQQSVSTAKSEKNKTY